MKPKPAIKEIKSDTTSNKKPPATFADTLKIDFPAAVFYSPDSLQLEKIKAVTHPATFDGIMHEYFYLLRNAHLVIRKYYPWLKIIDAKNIKYLLFIKMDTTKDCIDLDTKNEPYGLFIFNAKKSPQPVDMANIDSELGFYFSK